jgi:hypothetical protein
VIRVGCKGGENLRECLEQNIVLHIGLELIFKRPDHHIHTFTSVADLDEDIAYAFSRDEWNMLVLSRRVFWTASCRVWLKNPKYNLYSVFKKEKRIDWVGSVIIFFGSG